MKTSLSSYAFLMLACMSAPVAAQQQRQPADMIITADRIYTVDDTRPMVQALAIRGDRVIFAGPVAGARALAGSSTRMLDFPGRTIIPGMVDAHGHLMGLGEALEAVDLVGAKSYDEVIARVVARA